MPMTKPLHLLTNGRTAGFTLVEVLVTIVVMAVGLLGFAALQTVALKSSRTALHHSYATFYVVRIVGGTDNFMVTDLDPGQIFS